MTWDERGKKVVDKAMGWTIPLGLLGAAFIGIGMKSAIVGIGVAFAFAGICVWTFCLAATIDLAAAERAGEDPEKW